jgi:hypothetical protein
MTTIKADCDQKNKVEDGTLKVQDNIQGICAAISAHPEIVSFGIGVWMVNW